MPAATDESTRLSIWQAAQQGMALPPSRGGGGPLGMAVGLDRCGQEVTVRLDAASQEWVFCQGGVHLRRCEAANLSAENIRTLRVKRRPGRSAEQTLGRRVARAGAAPREAQAAAPEPAGASGEDEPSRRDHPSTRRQTFPSGAWQTVLLGY